LLIRHLQKARMAESRPPAVILIVDDEALVRLPLVLAVEDRGFAVLEASTGDEALAMLQVGTHVDLVVSDVRMPGHVNGFKLAAHIRSTWPELPVILTSGMWSDLDKPSPIPRGVVFLAKPYGIDDVLALVERLLAIEEQQPDAR
jgi:two-component system, response regulator PdtaR